MVQLNCPMVQWYWNILNDIQWYSVVCHWLFFVRVNFRPITACLIHTVTVCRGYRGACVGFLNPTFWQRNLPSLKWDQITRSA